MATAWLLSGFLSFVPGPPADGQPRQNHQRYPTEEDAIRMARIAGRGSMNSYAGALTEDFAYFSPDRKQFVIVVKKGNLERNTNDYSLLLFRASEAFKSPTPRVLASMSSSSNREAVTDVVWLSDNDSVLFLGENPGENAQLYSVSSSSGTLRRLTNHPTNLIEFSSDARGETVVYAAEKPAEPVLTDKSLREGVTVANEDMSDLLLGRRLDENRDLFVLNTKSRSSRPLRLASELKGQLYGDYLDFSLSPDGRQLVVRLNLLEVPESWHEYREPLLARVLNRELPKGSLLWAFRYAVIDTASGKGRVLLDAPVSYHGSEVVWLEDVRSVILTGVFLPLEAARGDSERLAKPCVVEIDLESLKYRKFSDEDLRFLEADHDRALLSFVTRQRASVAPEPRHFLRVESGWVVTNVHEVQAPVLSVTAQQDLNNPPKVAVSESQTGRKAVLFDPNPQFAEIEFGKVEEIRFKGAMHKEVRAGLYFPAGYVPGRKYPLVVQTHGFDPKSFWIDGSFTTAFAAQALASRGFLVLQVPDVHDWDETPAEAPNMAETLERAVEYVDGLGCVDRDRLGIIGFSRTGLYVHYLLAHSRLHFGAAVVADGSDGGYSQYLQFLNAHQFTASDSELINGGMPFGSGLLLWLRSSPEFFVDKVKTPLMLQVSSPDILSSMWAPFVGLRRLRKPVELLYFPTGTHIMEKPWDRLASQGSAVDWFTFWLKGEEDDSSWKAARYRRWQELRKQQAAEASAPLHRDTPTSGDRMGWIQDPA
jgi:dipeptidyl aminopeptidase/acylaminoacyl peptidase